MTVRPLVRRGLGSAVLFLVLLVFAVITLLPVLLVLLNSFKTGQQAAVVDLALPHPVQLSNYPTVLRQAQVLRATANGLVIAVASITVTLLFSAMAAYVVNRRRGKATSAIFWFLISGLIAPLAIIPEIRIMQFFGIMGTLLPVILVQVATRIPFTFFMFVGFMSTVSREIDESATIDGARPLRVFFTIILPLLQPALFTNIALLFIGIWNDFQVPLYFIPRSALYTMPLTVQKFFGFHTADMQYICVHMIYSLLPVLAVYLFAQKYVISGISTGAVKG
jgi:raffinose/stachyose/melibiose transport system permease protein